jgi:hypothetical protein
MNPENDTPDPIGSGSSTAWIPWTVLAVGALALTAWILRFPW